MLTPAKGLLALLAVVAVAPLQAAELPACPDSPNCVSSQASSERHRIDPLQVGETAEQAQAKLLAELASRPRVEITVNEPQRVEAEFTSAVLRFTDDVLFLINDNGVVDVRSASRVGYWDMGANRSRVEDLRESLAQPAE